MYFIFCFFVCVVCAFCLLRPLLSFVMLPISVVGFVFCCSFFSSQNFLATVTVVNAMFRCNNCFFILLYFHLATLEACCALKKSLYASTYIQVTCIYKCMYHDLKYECLQI